MFLSELTPQRMVKKESGINKCVPASDTVSPVGWTAVAAKRRGVASSVVLSSTRHRGHTDDTLLTHPQWTHRLRTGMGTRTLSADIHSTASMAPRKHLGKTELVFANKILYRRLFNFLLVQTLIHLMSGQ